MREGIGKITAPPGCMISMDHWVVDIWYDSDSWVRCGVGPASLTPQRAALAALKAHKIKEPSRVKDIKVRRLHEVWKRKSEPQHESLTERMMDRWVK